MSTAAVRRLIERPPRTHSNGGASRVRIWFYAKLATGQGKIERGAEMDLTPEERFVLDASPLRWPDR